MPSKEKIEKALNNLWNSLDEELFNLTYSQEEMQEDLRTVLNEYNYLDAMNNRKEQQIQQLKTREQKLIEKLKKDIKQHTFGDIEIDAIGQYAQEILKILKGENDE